MSLARALFACYEGFCHNGQGFNDFTILYGKRDLTRLYDGEALFGHSLLPTLYQTLSHLVADCPAVFEVILVTAGWKRVRMFVRRILGTSCLPSLFWWRWYCVWGPGVHTEQIKIFSCYDSWCYILQQVTFTDFFFFFFTILWCWQSCNQFGMTVLLSVPRYNWCTPLLQPSSCMFMNHGPSQQSSKEQPTSHGNEVLLQYTTCYQRGSLCQDPAGSQTRLSLFQHCHLKKKKKQCTMQHC